MTEEGMTDGEEEVHSIIEVSEASEASDKQAWDTCILNQVGIGPKSSMGVVGVIVE